MKLGSTVLLAIGALALAAPASAQSRAAGLKGNPGEFFGPDDYPPEALRAAQEGRVVAKLWIDTTGKVASCTVAQSSGSPSLDQKTCEIALAKVTFTPASDRRGQPIAASYILPVRWVLPKGAREMAGNDLDTQIEMTVSVDASGEVLACNATKSPGVPAQVNPCAGLPVGKQSHLLWLRGGKPVGGTMTQSFHQHVTLDP